MRHRQRPPARPSALRDDPPGADDDPPAVQDENSDWARAARPTIDNSEDRVDDDTDGDATSRSPRAAPNPELRGASGARGDPRRADSGRCVWLSETNRCHPEGSVYPTTEWTRVRRR